MAIGYVWGKLLSGAAEADKLAFRMCQHDIMPLNCGAALESELT
jgi:hypothetical protein